MKLAILGSNPLSLEALVRFHVHGAAVTWFRHPEEPDYFPLTTPLTWNSTTSEQGWELLGQTVPKVHFSFDAWVVAYRDPLIALLSSDQEIKPYKVISIAKRFLAPKEEIKESSRFHDLFRLIYQLNPTEFVEKQKLSDPEMYQRLSSEMMESLQSTLEMYDDFDLVLDLRTPLQTISMNETGRAMGEHRVSPDKLSKAYDILRDIPRLTTTSEIREMILVGSTDVALEGLLALKDWVLNPVNRLFVVTAEETPFEKVLQSASLELKGRFSDFMATIQTEWEKERTQFQEKLREWQALDDFVQAKKPKPTEPIPQVNFFSGQNVTAIDELIDRKRLFVTVEKPDFRDGKWQPENNSLDLKTLGVDHVLVGTPLRRENILSLDHGEKGYFSLTPQSANVAGGPESDFNKLKGIEDEIFKLFSPAHSL